MCCVCSSVQAFNAFEILWFHVIDLASQVSWGMPEHTLITRLHMH